MQPPRKTPGFVEVDGDELPARTGLLSAIDEAWERLAAPGTWWNGAERLAIAAEVRLARNCPLCRRRQLALSPYGVPGEHASQGGLPKAAVEAAHRLASDAARVTAAWVGSMVADIDAGGLGEERYVEIVSIVAIVTALDTFDLSLGRPCRPLPQPMPGLPSQRRPKGAKRDLAWVATVAPADVQPDEPNPYPKHGDKNIHRALSLVPQEVINFFDLDVELYLKDHEIRDFGHEHRAISHAQIELIAGRTSAINRCYY